VAHGERERHNAADQERAMFSGAKSKATRRSWVYDGQSGSWSPQLLLTGDYTHDHVNE
jgi:hypothetical protein